MRKITLLSASLAALALVACSDTTKEITAPPGEVSYAKTTSSTSSNSVSGPVWVDGAFSFDVIGGTGAGTNAQPQGHGHCHGEVWYSNNEHSDTDDHATSAPFCTGTTAVSSTITCSIDETSFPATYAWGGTGTPGTPQTSNNENLNLHSDLIAQALDQFVHYTSKKNATTGKDYTLFAYTCDDDGNSSGNAYFDLSQFNGSGNRFGGNYAPSGYDRGLDPAGISVLLDDDVTTADAEWIAWKYRSRVGTI